MVRGPWLIIMGSRLKINDRQYYRDAFQNDSKVRFLVGTPSTGGYGITLTAANTVDEKIYYSNGYDLEKRLQSEDRAHRIGQHKPVTYVDILAEETVDEKIVKSLRKKINIASEVLGEKNLDHGFSRIYARGAENFYLAYRSVDKPKDRFVGSFAIRFDSH